LVEDKGVRLETGGRTTPAWVEEMFGITKVEGLDVHIAHQKFPVFLLGEPPSKRSAVLSIGQEGRICATCRPSTGKDARGTWRSCATASASLGRPARRSACSRSCPPSPRTSRPRGPTWARSTPRLHRLRRLEGCAEDLRAARSRLEDARRGAQALRDLPDPGRLAEIAAELAASRERERAAERLLATSRALAAARSRRAALSGLPSSPPPLDETTAAARIADALAGLRAQLREAEARRTAAEAGMQDVASRIAALVEEMGGLCPTCGAPVEAAALLDAHAHA
jgi:hypothetical protein